MIGRDVLAEVSRLLRPIRVALANSIARAVVQLVDDAKKQQMAQLGVLEGEDVDDAEHFQPYGFSSVPFPGAEAIVIFPGGDRGHPLVPVVADRRYRPTGGQAGEVVLYTDEGDQVRLGRGHVISLSTTGQVKLGSTSASSGVIKGGQRDTAEQTFLTALSTYVSAIAAVADPGGTATAAMTAAITAFKTAATAAISTKVKVE